jgi:hypothetical protein
MFVSTYVWMPTFGSDLVTKIFGPKQAKEVWSVRYNEKIHKFYGNVAFPKCLHLKGLQWAGHVLRADDSRVSKRVMGRC